MTRSCLQGASCLGEHTSAGAVVKSNLGGGKQNYFESSKWGEILPGWRDPFRLMRAVICERSLDKTIGC